MPMLGSLWRRAIRAHTGFEIGDHQIDAAGIEAADVGVKSEKIQAAGGLEVLQPSAPGGKRSGLPGDEGFKRLHVPKQRRISSADERATWCPSAFRWRMISRDRLMWPFPRCPGPRRGFASHVSPAVAIPPKALRRTEHHSR